MDYRFFSSSFHILLSPLFLFLGLFLFTLRASALGYGRFSPVLLEVAGHRPGMILHRFGVRRHTTKRRTYGTFARILVCCDFRCCPRKVPFCPLHLGWGVEIRLLERGVNARSIGEGLVCRLLGRPVRRSSPCLFVARMKFSANRGRRLYLQRCASGLQPWLLWSRFLCIPS